jgi:hypothetical protein
MMEAAQIVVALAGGSFIFLGVMIVGLMGVVYGYFTITGSGIDEHPNDGRDGAPGSEGPSQASGMGRSTGDTGDGHGAGDTFSTHGTG